MRTLDVRTLEVTIGRAFEEAYRFLAEPANFPRWASGLASGLERVGDGWVAVTPEGRAEVRFTAPNPHGVLDHTVRFPDGRTVEIPMRLIANGDGATLLFTLFRQPGMSEAQFAADADWARRDLATLRDLLEGAPGGLDAGRPVPHIGDEDRR